MYIYDIPSIFMWIIFLAVIGVCGLVFVFLLPSPSNDNNDNHDEEYDDIEEILSKFRERLDNEISQQTEPLHFVFTANSYHKGNCSDEDLIELRGYYKGLKVAREMLERTISEYNEETEDQEENNEHAE